MEYTLLLFADPAGWAALTPAKQQEGMAAYGAYTQALKQAQNRGRGN